MIEYINHGAGGNKYGAVSDAQAQTRLVAACTLASHLLYPEFIFNTVLYWIVNYNNYTDIEREEQMFGDMIHHLLTKRPTLRLRVASETMHAMHNTYVQPSYVQLLGCGRHAVPMEYYERTFAVSFTEVMQVLNDPQLACFTQRTPVGINGALELSGNIHDGVVEYFYEPSFVIITAYMLHLLFLIRATGGRESCDWLPRHYASLVAIDECSDAAREWCCLSDPTRMSELRRELRQLYDILNTSQLEQALVQVRELWEAKASYCWSEIFVRIAALC
jgi:hypothetical protein